MSWPRTRGWRAGRVVAVASIALALVAGCVSEPTRTVPGETAAAVLQRLGAPTGRYPLPAGGERLQYSRAPAGFEVTNIDVDAAGQVRSVVQVMNEGLFGQEIQVGSWRVADVLRTYGRPFEISRVTSFDGEVWAWRYRTLNAPRLLYIYVDPAGVVQRYHVADDYSRERLLW